MCLAYLSASTYLFSCAFSSVFDAKRLIGRKFDDAEVQADLKHFPFKVFNKGGKPYIRVEYRGEQKEFVRSIVPACWKIWLMSFLFLVSRRNLFHGPPQDEGDR